MDMEQARFNMIEQQIRTYAVLDDTVLQTMGNLPRELFVPENFKALAYSDIQVPLAHGETMMFPRIEGRLLQELELGINDTCLEVGTGSGFVTACLANMCKHVDSFDIHDDFIESAQQTLSSLGIANVTIEKNDVLKTLTTEKKYDAIAVTGSLPEYLPLFEQLLKPNGRLFIVVGTRQVACAMKVVRVSDSDNFTRTNLFETELKLLQGTSNKSSFTF